MRSIETAAVAAVLPAIATIAMIASIAACGRSAPDGFSAGAGDSSMSQAPRDAEIINIDGGPIFEDARVVDTGVVDTGGVPECITPVDCISAHGIPPACPDGRRGTWRCTEGQCVNACEGTTCVNDCDCPFELACLGGSCMVANRENQCCDNPRCRPGNNCVDQMGNMGTCPMRGGDAGVMDGGRRDAGQRDTGIPDSGTTETPVGAECQNMMSVCGPNGFCIDEQNGFPGGYCSEDCGGMMSMCPGDAVCRRVGPMNAICLDGCMSNTDCRSGYACIQLGIGMDRVCWPIPVGSMNPNGAPVGDMCTMDDDCATSETCLDPPGPGWNDGYCTKQFCDVMSNPCPSGSLCYNFPGLFSLCLVECPNAGSRSTCRMGYYCLGPQGQSGVCVTN